MWRTAANGLERIRPSQQCAGTPYQWLCRRLCRWHRRCWRVDCFGAFSAHCEAEDLYCWQVGASFVHCLCYLVYTAFVTIGWRLLYHTTTANKPSDEKEKPIASSQSLTSSTLTAARPSSKKTSPLSATSTKYARTYEQENLSSMPSSLQPAT